MSIETAIHISSWEESDDNLFQPGSGTYWKDLYFPDASEGSSLWRVPGYFQDLPKGIRGEIMYRVHAILWNITVSPEELDAIHSDLSFFDHLDEAQKYLSNQLKISTHTLH